MYKLLIVEDEHLVMDSLVKGIPWSEIGFEVSGSASNGAEALLLIEKNTPDVVITDIRMPIMDGIELCKIIKQQYPGIKTVILSGYGEFEFAQKAILYDVYSYILKPVNDEKLIEVFNNIFEALEYEKNHEYLYNNIKGKTNNIIEYTFLKILSGNSADYKQYLDELSKVGFDINNTKYCVFVCNFFNSKDETSLTVSMVLKLINSINDTYRIYSFYIQGLYYVVLCTKHFLSNNDIERFAQKFKKEIESRITDITNQNSPVSIGIGTIVDDISYIKDSATAAVYAIQYEYYSGEGSVNFYCKLAPTFNKECNNAEFKKVTDCIVSAILELREAELVPQLKKLFELFKALNYIDTNKLFIKCIKLYSSIIAALREKHNFIEVYSEDEVFYKISSHKTFCKMADEFENIILELLNQIKFHDLTSNRHQLIAKITKHINSKYYVDLSLDKLSREFYINSSYLSKLFKEETGENISDYIMSVRIKKAKNLLNTSNAKIQDISRDVGYEDYRHFCTVFKKATGVSPLQYRIKSLI